MSVLTVDFHTHILPGVDDGSRSVDESLEMLKIELSDGVRTIMLTPHFYPQQMFPETFLKKRQCAFEQLCRSLSVDIPKLILGAEVLFYPGISQWEQLDQLTLGESKYILIEMPFSKWSDNTYDELKKIKYERGLTPIIAHIDRYLSRFHYNRTVNRLLDIPVLLQMNCECLTNPHTRNFALRLISKKKIHLFGSDCHNTENRPPVMAQAREILISNIDQESLSFLEKAQTLILED